MTQYLVLQEETQGPTADVKRQVWRDVGRGEARSARAAIRAYLQANGAKAGTFVAVPVRSWDPQEVKTETQTKLVFS